MTDYSWITNEMMDQAIRELAVADGAESLLFIPGVWEPVAERYNNDALKLLEERRPTKCKADVAYAIGEQEGSWHRLEVEFEDHPNTYSDLSEQERLDRQAIRAAMRTLHDEILDMGMVAQLWVLRHWDEDEITEEKEDEPQ
jgi:hypothetical protein